MKILLNTCTFLWIVSDAPELTEAGKTVFSDPDNEVYLSSVSVWEILVKYLLGKLSISGSPECFIREQREQHDIDTLPLDEVSALHLPVLPKLHRDPFDRMLVCQAIEHNLTILTPDPMIIQYPIKVIW
jgi:PIN domain nuclease of toxin-antitoxin system